MKQKAFQTEPGQYPLRGLVARRLFGKFSDTEQQAVGKQIFTGSDGISFSMHKVSLRAEHVVCSLATWLGLQTPPWIHTW